MRLQHLGPPISPRTEDAWLTDLGIDFHKSISPSWNIRAKADAFLNHLSNKITSAPTEEDPNIWLPFNIGKVRSSGFDIITGADYESGDWKVYMDMKYSYQSAVDRTPGSYSCGQQLPYLAKHTVTADLKASWKGYSLSPRWVLKTGRTDSAGTLADWNTLDVTAEKEFTLKKARLTINLSAKNLLNCRYELASGYPMPGRSLTGGIEFGF